MAGSLNGKVDAGDTQVYLTSQRAWAGQGTREGTFSVAGCRERREGPFWMPLGPFSSPHPPLLCYLLGGEWGVHYWGAGCGHTAGVLHVSALWALFPPQAYSLISCPEEGNGRSAFVKAFPEEGHR